MSTDDAVSASTYTLVFELGGLPATARSTRVLLYALRSHIHSATAGGRKATVAPMGRQFRVVDLPGAPSELTLSVEGEVPSIVGIWSNVSGADVRPAPPRGEGILSLAMSSSSEAFLTNLETRNAATEPDDVIWARTEAEWKTVTETQRRYGFFRVLDKLSVDTGPGVVVAQQVTEWLLGRLWARMRGQPVPAVPAFVTDNLAGLEEVMLRAFRMVWGPLPQPGQPLAVTHQEEAFLEFAAGAFASANLPEGQPDSGQFFIFAEFALVAAESNKATRQDFWRALAPGLVAAQEAYLSAYAPPPPAQLPAEYRSFRPENRDPAVAPATHIAAGRVVLQRLKADPSSFDAAIKDSAERAARSFIPPGRESIDRLPARPRFVELT